MKSVKTNNQDHWVVYMIQTVSGRFYTGITNNIHKRWQAHLNGTGAKFFRSDKPQHILFQEFAIDRSSASRREYQIKQLTRQQKWILIRTQSPFRSEIIE